MNAPAAGWYTNPSGPGRRYWDGERWTEHVDESLPVAPYQSVSASAPPPGAYPSYPPQQPPAYYPAYGQPQSQGTSGLVICGWIFAFLAPLVGFILGIVTVTRQDPNVSKHGVWIIVASVVAFITWYAILIAAGAEGT